MGTDSDRWEEQKKENEAEKQMLASKALTDAWIKGSITGDFATLHDLIGYSLAEFERDVLLSWSEKFDSLVTRVFEALQSADRLPPFWQAEWQFQVKQIRRDLPQMGLKQVEGITTMIPFVGDQFRPRREGIDLKVFAQLEFDRQLLRIRHRLMQLEAWLNAAAGERAS